MPRGYPCDATLENRPRRAGRRPVAAGAALVERWDNARMNASPPISPRRRLQELLAIPERERTDAQWDEINELEIKLSSANREQTLEQGARRNTSVTATGHPKPSGGAQGKKAFKKVHKRRSNERAP